MTNRKYEKARNLLIPFATREANMAHGKESPPIGPNRLMWYTNWNASFLKAMDRLAVEHGVITKRKELL